MQFKKMISLLTGTALLASMTACGDSDSGSEGGASEAIAYNSYYTEPKIAPKAVVTENGELYTWGYYENEYNYNDGASDSDAVPKIVMDDVKSVASHENHHAAVKTNGDLYAWREYWTKEDDEKPETIITSKPTKIMENVISFDINYIGTIAAVTDDGSLYKWGHSYSSYESNSSGADIIQNEPEKIMDNVKYVDLDAYNGALITKNGELYTWGNNKNGQLGNGKHGSEPVLEPTKVMDNVVYADITERNCAAITENGDLYVWGSYSEENDYQPVKLMENVKYVNLNSYAIFAITNDGSLYEWSGSFSEDYAYIFNHEPEKIMDNVKYVSSCNSKYSKMNMLMTEDNEIYTWGSNYDGALGLGTIDKDPHPTPIRISIP